jgi:hypothetical protein
MPAAAGAVMPAIEKFKIDHLEFGRKFEAVSSSTAVCYGEICTNDGSGGDRDIELHVMFLFRRS